MYAVIPCTWDKGERGAADEGKSGAAADDETKGGGDGGGAGGGDGEDGNGDGNGGDGGGGEAGGGGVGFTLDLAISAPASWMQTHPGQLADLTDAVSDGEDEVGEEYLYGFPKRTEEEAFEFEDARGRQVAALHGTLAALAQGVMGMRGSVEELSAKVAQMHG